ncbi:neurofilament triplet m protein-like protein [Anaeramoeba flamelloides]|uniref:Neurofilament triplet m protein-like protein n=1 Tax=Anaeramoeba flamelloides TaxID=1746091 RepID=A0ABQ8Z7D6_9EUKA|nr:neurofilament triplet m protein-like protein [Anaeramoeba flamelloides]
MGDFFSKEGDHSLISDVFDQEGDEGEALFLVKNINSLDFSSIKKKETTKKLKEKKIKEKNSLTTTQTTKIQIMPILVPLSKDHSLKKEKEKEKENVKENEKEETKQIQQKEYFKKKKQEKDNENGQGNEKRNEKEKENKNENKNENKKEKTNKEMVTNRKTKNSDLLKPIQTNQENKGKKGIFLISEREEDLIEQEVTPDRFEFGRTSSDGFFDESDESELNSFISDNVIGSMDTITSYYSQEGNNFNNKVFGGDLGVIKFDDQEQELGQLYLSEKQNFKFGLDPDWNFVGQQTQLILDEEDLIEKEIEANDNEF